jgi:hypothetical protein
MADIIDIIVAFRGGPNTQPIPPDAIFPDNSLAAYNLKASQAQAPRRVVRIGSATKEIRNEANFILEKAMNDMRDALKGQVLGRIFIWGTNAGGRNAIDLAVRLSNNNRLTTYLGVLDAAFYPNETDTTPRDPQKDPPEFKVGFLLVGKKQNLYQLVGKMSSRAKANGCGSLVTLGNRSTGSEARLPSNTTKFEKDYPKGKRKSLTVNYRSREEIVNTFVTYADDMAVGRDRDSRLAAKRGSGADAVDYNVATERAAEIAGLVSAVQHHRSRGRSYKEQAILCRGHSYLQRIAAGLEAAGVPVLNLGEIFEREEVRMASRKSWTFVSGNREAKILLSKRASEFSRGQDP